MEHITPALAVSSIRSSARGACGTCARHESLFSSSHVHAALASVLDTVDHRHFQSSAHRSITTYNFVSHVGGANHEVTESTDGTFFFAMTAFKVPAPEIQLWILGEVLIRVWSVKFYVGHTELGFGGSTHHGRGVLHRQLHYHVLFRVHRRRCRLQSHHHGSCDLPFGTHLLLRVGSAG